MFEVDEEELALHDGEKKPPPDDVEDWEYRDLYDAHSLGIVTDEGELSMLEPVEDHEA